VRAIQRASNGTQIAGVCVHNVELFLSSVLLMFQGCSTRMNDKHECDDVSAKFRETAYRREHKKEEA
jgi:hypothetical protein